MKKSINISQIHLFEKHGLFSIPSLTKKMIIQPRSGQHLLNIWLNTNPGFKISYYNLPATVYHGLCPGIGEWSAALNKHDISSYYYDIDYLIVLCVRLSMNLSICQWLKHTIYRSHSYNWLKFEDTSLPSLGSANHQNVCNLMCSMLSPK